ncbi:MAG TPA: hypothetical protein VFB54_08325 [Burkholderiales bacterium]|nr:hypothetical protein [Burkholderiales bacterium]
MDDDLSLYLPYQEPPEDSTWAAASLAQIQYAEQLRLQIRESYLTRPAPSPAIIARALERMSD